MKKTYTITGLDCITCANALETKLNTITGVKSAQINFFLNQLTLEADDSEFDDILNRVKRAANHSVPGTTLT